MNATALARRSRIPVVNDNDLLYLIGRRHSTALRVMLYVRKRAMLKGQLHADVRNIDIQRDLGLDRRQVQRAKAYLRELGFAIEEQVCRARGQNGKSGHRACRFHVDRRRIPALAAYEPAAAERGDDDRPGAVPDAASNGGEKQRPPEERLRLALQEDVGRAHARDRSPPAAASPNTPDGATTTEAPPSASVPVSSPADGLPRPSTRADARPELPRAAAVEPELSQLRSWLAAARGSALTGQRAAAVLDRAEVHVLAAGGDRWRTKLARSVLALELGADQLVLDASGTDAIPRPSDGTDVNTADVDADEGASPTAPAGGEG